MARWWRLGRDRIGSLPDVRRQWLRLRWEIVSAAALVTLALGWWGFDRYFARLGTPRPLVDSLYRSLSLFVFEGGDVAGPVPLSLQVARFLAPLVVFAAALGAAMSVLHVEIQRFMAHRVMRDHVVVVGLGVRGLQLARQMIDNGRRCVIVDVVSGEAHSTTARRLGIPVVTCGEADPDLADAPQLVEALHRAGVRRAAAVVVMTGSPSLDARFAHVLYELLDRGEAPAHAFVELDDVDELPGAVGVGFTGSGPHVEWFSLADRAAKALLDKLDEVLAVTDDRGHRHLVVVGATPVGRSVIVQAARNWNRDLQRRRDPAVRLVLTLVEPSTSSESELRQIEDLEVQLLQRRDPRVPSATSTSGELYVKAWDATRTTLADLLVIEPSAVIVTAASDQELLRHSAKLTTGLEGSVPVWLCTERSGGIVDVMSGTHSAARNRHVHVFHLLDTVLREDGIRRGTDEELARAVHQAHRRYRTSTATAPADLNTVRPWDELSTDLRALNHATVAAWRKVLYRHGYRFAPYSTLGAEATTLAPDLVEELAVAAHEAWSDEKHRQGYRRGLRRNDDPTRGQLIHPEVGLPFRDLSDDGKEWNRSQARAVPEHLAAAGLQLDPLPGGTEEVALTDAAVETLAVAIHELYRNHVGTTDGWEELSAPLRESNRAAARALPEQLARLGYRIQTFSASPPAVRQLTDAEVDEMAEAEHDRWMDHMRLQGYVHGSTRDDDAAPPTHPDLVSWSELDESARNKDRIRFRMAPALLAQAGYGLVPDARRDG